MKVYSSHHTISADRVIDTSYGVISLFNCSKRAAWTVRNCMRDSSWEISATGPDMCRPASYPKLLIVEVKCSKLMKTLRSRGRSGQPISGDIPVLFLVDQKPSPDVMDLVLESGAGDCLSMTMDPSELRIRIKSVVMHNDILHKFHQRQQKIEVEREHLTNNFRQLEEEAARRRREAIINLELLICSREVHETLLDKIHDLRPFLSEEGMSQLDFITGQLKWELIEERRVNAECRFDDNHREFYHLLEERSERLTLYEKRLCAYFLTNRSSVAVARVIRKSLNCVNVAFARIRGKLGISNNKELAIFLEELNLDKVAGSSIHPVRDPIIGT